MFNIRNITEIAVRVIVILMAISIHEAAHGFAAYKLGDYTAKSMGRISLNPMHHLDPVGALCMLVFGFGWAKPVMVNPYNMKNPKRDMAIVSAAGPVSNFIAAFLSVAAFKLLVVLNLPDIYIVRLLLTVFSASALLNIGLGVFNLIPIPPLDGSKIFLPLLPSKLYYDIMRYERFGWIVLMAALWLGVLNPVMGPLRDGILSLFKFLVGGGI